MYNILQNGAVIGTCDSITHIKTGKNGTYRVCGPNQADGFCVKLPKEFDMGDGTTETVQATTVFCLPDHDMTGNEPVGTWEIVEEESTQNPDTPSEEPVTLEKLASENKTLKAQVSALIDQNDFHEELIVELANIVYA